MKGRGQGGCDVRKVVVGEGVVVRDIGGGDLLLGALGEGWLPLFTSWGEVRVGG